MLRPRSTRSVKAARQAFRTTSTTQRRQTSRGRMAHRQLDLMYRQLLVRVLDRRVAFRTAARHHQCHHLGRSRPCQVARRSTKPTWTRTRASPATRLLRRLRSMRSDKAARPVFKTTSTTQRPQTSRGRMAHRQLDLIHRPRCPCQVPSRRMKTLWTRTRTRASPATRLLRRLRSMRSDKAARPVFKTTSTTQRPQTSRGRMAHRQLDQKRRRLLVRLTDRYQILRPAFHLAGAASSREGRCHHRPSRTFRSTSHARLSKC